MTDQNTKEKPTPDEPVCGLCGMDGGHEPGCPALKLDNDDQRLVNSAVAGQVDLVKASEAAMRAQLRQLQGRPPGQTFPSPFTGQPSHVTKDGMMVTPLNPDDPAVRGLHQGGLPPGMAQPPGGKQMGWICPICNTGVSPFVPFCLNCNRRGNLTKAAPDGDKDKSSVQAD